MAIELRQQLRLSQQLVMTPQLQQAIKLLQLNRQELTSLIEQELQENPVLEESEIEDQTPAEVADQTPGEEGAERPEDADSEAAPENPAEAEAPGPAAEEGGDAALSDAEKIADIEWENYMESSPQTGLESRTGGEDDRPSIDQTLTRRPSLAEHLDWQIHLSAFDREEVAISPWIIGNLDDTGNALAQNIGVV